MTQAASDIFRAALALPAEERAELIEELLSADHNGERPSLSPEWLAEIRRRSAEYDAGLVKTIPWEEVKQTARERGRPRG